MHPAQKIDHQDPVAALGLKQLRASPRRIGKRRIVQRPDQARLTDNIGQGLFLVPGMIAKRQTIGPRLKQFAGRVFGNTKARRRVFGIHNHKFKIQLSPKTGQMIGQTIAARLANHVSKKSKAHIQIFLWTGI